MNAAQIQWNFNKNSDDENRQTDQAKNITFLVN